MTANQQSPRLYLDVAPQHQRSAPGERSVFIINVANRDQEAQQQSVLIEGLPARWFTLDFDERRRVFPGEQRSSTLLVTIPDDAPPDMHRFQVIARAGSEESTVFCSLEVLAPSPRLEEPVTMTRMPAPGLQIVPSQAEWPLGSNAGQRYTLTVRNVGGETSEYRLSLEGIDSSWYSLPASVSVPAREARDLQFEVRPTGNVRPSEFTFRARAAVAGSEDVYAEVAGGLTVTPASDRPAIQPTTAATPPPVQTPRPAQPVLPPEVTLSPRSTFRFGPGEVATAAVITVQNKSSLIERYQVEVEGLPEEWFNLERAELNLQPGASVQVPLRLTPRPGPTYPAGDYPFRIRVAPHSFPESFAEIGAVVTIIGVAAFDARLTPAQTQGRKEKFKLTLVNTGAAALNLWMEGSDPGGACKFSFKPPPPLEPGDEAVVPVWLGAHRNGLVGKPQTYDFRLRVLPAGAQSAAAKSFDARLVHQPFLSPRFFGLSLLLAALITIVGVVLALGTSSIDNVSAWVQCNMDDDFQEVRGGPVLVKESCGGAPIEEQKGTANAVASPTATPAAVTPTVVASPAACTPSGNIRNGQQVTVISSTNVRRNPGRTGEILRTLRADTPATVTAVHQCADGLVWWNVDLGDLRGWAAEIDQNNVVLIKPR
jgi:uncharacterized membrane protein